MSSAKIRIGQNVIQGEKDISQILNKSVLKHFSPTLTVLHEFMTQRDGTMWRLRPAAATYQVISLLKWNKLTANQI